MLALAYKILVINACTSFVLAGIVKWIGTGRWPVAVAAIFLGAANILLLLFH